MGKIQIREEWDEKEFLKSANNYQLVYIFSNVPLAVSDPSIQFLDTKITYKKLISGENKLIEEITPYTGGLTEKLLKLVLGSGMYSRFKIDPRLKHDEFRKLYKLWIQKALKSDSVLGAPNLQGMVVFSVEEKSAGIDLLAVSEENQGQGWGKKLMKAAEFYAASRGALELSVVTQEVNYSAGRLYRSLGYELIKKEYVYHYWRNNQR